MRLNHLLLETNFSDHPKWFDERSGNWGNLVSVFIINSGVWCADNPKHNASMLIDSVVPGSNPI